MSELVYYTGYEVDDWAAESYYCISKILHMELLLAREQRTNNYQIPPKTISEIRGLDNSHDMMDCFIGYCSDIMRFLDIGDVFDGGKENKDNLLLRYSSSDDAKTLDSMIHDLDQHSYGDEMFFVLSLEKLPHLSDEERESFIDKFSNKIERWAMLLDCGLPNNRYDFSDGLIVFPIAYQAAFEVHDVLYEFFEDISEMHDVIKKGKGDK